jgi:hypothetical protein
LSLAEKGRENGMAMKDNEQEQFEDKEGERVRAMRTVEAA